MSALDAPDYNGSYAVRKSDFSGMAEYAKFGDVMKAQNRILTVLTQDMIRHLDSRGFHGN